MSGINGIIHIDKNQTSIDLSSIIEKMNNRVIHRGLDIGLKFVEKSVAIGVRKNLTIDFENSKRMMMNDDKNIIIVFDGVIYNYSELKENLELKGYTFKTNLDDEVILYHYQEFGINGFNKLKGMFAFSIYDRQREKILLVRDRAGEKPLYYYKNKQFFLFSSELKSIIATGLVKKK